ncbi:hypothetical protein J7E45_11965 [Microbacterium sp. ISL-59]|uniref:hypothetical protein n=1 Tax=Microbacterium sp. ISL-59 TaxID=2819159 RepID=UPI001BE93C24|nr:hypothetical protein [Microbacterium sp. ISL-59]MBT2496322.1 hypothetical protein [Microbacterium sp. ISL-59]
MTWTPSATRRLGTAAAIVTLAILPLSGCLYAQIPAAAPSSAPSPGTETDGTDAPDAPTGGTTLTFEEGLDLDPDTYIEWGDGFIADEQWEMVSPDDGNGGWTYGTADGTCTVRFWQGHMTDVPVVEGDDSASSDAILGVLLETPTSDITPVATTGEFSYMAGGNGGVEMRQVSAVDGSRSWLMAARAFTRTGVGLYTIVDCTANDAEKIMDAVTEANAIVVTP